MIVLTGATGHIGRHLVPELMELDAPVRVMSRDPSRLGEYRGKIGTVAGDYDDPATLAAAFEGATTLFMLAAGPDVQAQDAAMIAEAELAGVKHVVMLSSLGAELGGIGGGRVHQPGEALLRGSAMSWTILHPSEFMSNTLWWRETINAEGAIFVPTAAGRVGFVDPADIAAVAAHVLTTGDHRGETYRLTGPEALTTAEIAAKLSAALGRPVRHVDLPEEPFRVGMQQAGLPVPLVDMQIEYCAAIRAGTVDVVTDDVSRLLGRPARDFETWARDHAADFDAPR